VVAVSTMLVMLFTPLMASAATPDDVISALKQGITVNGQTRQLPSEFIKKAKDFLDSNPQITAEQLDGTVAAVNKAKALWEADGSLYWSGLKQSTRDKIVAIAEAEAERLGATVTTDGDTTSIVGADGRTITVSPNSSAIKQTGQDFTAPIATGAGMLLLLVGTLIVARKKGLFAAA